MGERVALRPVAPGDEAFLQRAYASTRADELAVVNWNADQKRAFVAMQFAAQHQHYREHYADAAFGIVLVGGEPAGRLYVARWPGEFRIVDLALLPEYRDRGIGGGILRDLQAEAAAAGKPLRIHVEIFNPARRLYERLGFRTIEDKGVYHFMEWRPDAA